MPVSPLPFPAFAGGATAFSTWARARLAAQPGLAAQLAVWATAPFARALMQERLRGANENTLDRALRELRRDVMLTVMERDLAGVATLDEVTQTMTALAEEAMRASVAMIEAALALRYGVPRGESAAAGGPVRAGEPAQTGALAIRQTRQQLHVVGMGKLGGGELNVSSDIDLIFLYPEEGVTRGGEEKPLHGRVDAAALDRAASV